MQTASVAAPENHADSSGPVFTSRTLLIKPCVHKEPGVTSASTMTFRRDYCCELIPSSCSCQRQLSYVGMCIWRIRRTPHDIHQHSMNRMCVLWRQNTETAIFPQHLLLGVSLCFAASGTCQPTGCPGDDTCIAAGDSVRWFCSEKLPSVYRYSLF